MSLYAQPKDVETEIFARVPENLEEQGDGLHGAKQHTWPGY